MSGFFRRRRCPSGSNRQAAAVDDALSLGSLLASSGIPISTIQDALEFQREHSDEELGRILVETGAISQEYLDLMLQKQRALRQADTAATVGVLRSVTNFMQPPRAEHQRLRDIALCVVHAAGKVGR